MQPSKLGPRMRGFRLLELKRGSTSFARIRPACCVFRVVLSCRRRLGWIVKTRRAAFLRKCWSRPMGRRNWDSLGPSNKTANRMRMRPSPRSINARPGRQSSQPHNALCCCRKSRQRERGRRRTRQDPETPPLSSRRADRLGPAPLLASFSQPKPRSGERPPTDGGLQPPQVRERQASSLVSAPVSRRQRKYR